MQLHQKIQQDLPIGSKVIAFPGNQIQIVLLPGLLGQGQFGAVHLAYARNNPSVSYAVKVIERKRLHGRTQQLLVNEITILQELNSPNVVSLATTTKTASNYYLVMEHCNGGDLEGFLKARGGHLCEDEAKLILHQIVTGLQALKSLNVMHRDLKLANILVHFPSLTKEQRESPNFNLKTYISQLSLLPGEEQPPTEIVIKIADLGFARKLPDGHLAQTRVGTPLIMAPEVLDGNPFDQTADVWSLGCIFYELLVGISAFTGRCQASLAQNIAKGDYFIPKTVKLSIQGLSFINACLQYSYADRPTVRELIQHPYLAEQTSSNDSEENLFLSFVPSERVFQVQQGDGQSSDLSTGFELLGAGSTLNDQIKKHADILAMRYPHKWLSENSPLLAIGMNVNGSSRYEEVVAGRIAKYEALAKQLEQEKMQEQNLAAHKQAQLDGKDKADDADDSLLIDEAEDTFDLAGAQNNNSKDALYIQTDFLLPNSIVGLPLEGAPDKEILPSLTEVTNATPGQPKEESKQAAATTAIQAMNNRSVIDVLDDSSFQLTVDSTMIVVKNRVTNTDQLTLDKIGCIEKGYF